MSGICSMTYLKEARYLQTVKYSQLAIILT